MCQTSKSRAAQERLAELEKLSAPFEEQLEEAAKFVGVDLNTISGSKQDEVETSEKTSAAIYHGREEWLLKWLLKRLQTPGDVEPRYTSLRYLKYAADSLNSEIHPHHGGYCVTSCRFFHNLLLPELSSTDSSLQFYDRHWKKHGNRQAM